MDLFPDRRVLPARVIQSETSVGMTAVTKKARVLSSAMTVKGEGRASGGAYKGTLIESNNWSLQ